MITAGRVLNNILEAMHASSDKGQRDRVWRMMNNEYFDIARMTSWDFMRSKLTLDFSAAGVTDAGLQLPSDLIGIDMVRDQDGYEYWERNRSDIEPDEYGNRYYRYKIASTPLYFGVDLKVLKGGASFLSAGLTSAGTTVLNEYLCVGSALGFYKITSNVSPFTFTPTYNGDKQDAAEFYVRPPETERMVIIDAGEEVLLDRQIDVYYWHYPIPLNLESDPVLLPRSDFLELRVLRKLAEAKINRPVSQGELEKAEAETLKANPQFPRASNPRDKHGNLFAFKTNLFKRR